MYIFSVFCQRKLINGKFRYHKGIDVKILSKLLGHEDMNITYTATACPQSRSKCGSSQRRSSKRLHSIRFRKILLSESGFLPEATFKKRSAQPKHIRRKNKKPSG